MKKTVRVTITCARMVDLQTTVDMPEAQYNKIKDLIGDDVKMSDSDKFFIIDGAMGPHSIIGADDEFLDVTVSKK